MRRTAVILVLLLGPIAVPAANPGDGPPPRSNDVVRAQANSYAHQMMVVARYVDERYVRPVPMANVLEAALAGLYETAREPMPSGLKADLQRAKADGEFRHILAAARERLGDVEALRDQRALYASLKTMPRALDPYSGLPANDRRTYSQETMEGVGLEFEATPENAQQFSPERSGGSPTDGARHRGPARVSAVMPGSPAQRAGIRPGDALTHINDHPLETPEGAQLFPQLFSTATDYQARLKLTFHRPGRDEFYQRELLPVQYICESVFGVRRRPDNDWDYLIDRTHKIGYVRLGFIDLSSDSEMFQAIYGLKAAGMRALIFDLRGCPGGFVDPARDISGMFIKEGLIATITDRREGERKHRIENGSGILEGIPTIVLIDGDTRGGGEMIAAVLQDHGVAKLAGQRTFGKGSVQRTDPIDGLNQIQLKLTTGLFTRPSGKTLHRFPESRPSDDWGIRPDPGLEFPITPALAKQVKEWMEQMALRPGDSREPLPLDDPENDPLRDFARRELVKRLSAKH